MSTTNNQEFKNNLKTLESQQKVFTIINVAQNLNWAKRIAFLSEFKEFLNQNPACPVCGKNHYKDIKETKGDYYSVQKTDYKGKNHFRSGLFSSSSHYEPISKIEYEKRLKYNNYHCTYCQTNFERFDDFDLLLYFNGFDSNNINILDNQKHQLFMEKFQNHEMPKPQKISFLQRLFGQTADTYPEDKNWNSFLLARKMVKEDTQDVISQLFNLSEMPGESLKISLKIPQFLNTAELISKPKFKKEIIFISKLGRITI